MELRNILPTSFPQLLRRILSETPLLQKAYLVGGSVRDALSGEVGKDYDIEVFGCGYEELVHALRPWGRPDFVGRSFGVVRLATEEFGFLDFSIARRDSKTAAGHKGFSVELDPFLRPEDACARRDFTINSMMYDLRKGELIDYHGGLSDLRNGVLRHTSGAFTEDPLRVLRGMQFAGRFGLTVAPETLGLCRSIIPTYHELALERVRDEWFKWAEKSIVPSAGLQFLVQTGWIEHFPEIQAMMGVPQDPAWHPEGDVFVHTCHCCDAMVSLPEWQSADATTRIVLMLAILCHDFAKPQTTQRALKNGEWRIVSPGHEGAGGPLTLSFLERINAPNEYRDRVVPLVTHHLAHLQTLTDRAVRRLARSLAPETIEHLCTLIAADAFGRPPRPRELPGGVKPLLETAARLSLEAQAPRPILLGRHLLELGMQPGPKFAPILAAAMEAQLEGDFFDLDGARKWLQQHLATVRPADPQ